MLTKKVGRSVRRALQRAGKCLDELDPEPDPLASDDPTLAALYGSSVVGRIATGARAGRRVEQLGDRVTVDDVEQITSRRCAQVQGFSLHADVDVPARDRKRLERLSRYIARPPLANERLHRRSDGKLVYLFRKPWRDGTRGVVFTSAELIEKLIALIPPPQANLLRYHGVLAPGSRLRNLVVGDRRHPTDAGPRLGSRCGGTSGSVPLSVPRGCMDETSSFVRGVSGLSEHSICGPVEVVQRADPEGLKAPTSAHVRDTADSVDDGSIAAALSREPLTSSGVGLGFQSETWMPVRRRMSWADLMKRVFELDVLECPACHGPMKIIAEITEPKVIKRFLAAMDLPTEMPEVSAARPPPQLEFGWPEDTEIPMRAYD